MNKTGKACCILLLGALLAAAGTLAGCGEPHEHDLQRVAAHAATCTENGNSQYWYCEGCGKYFSDAEATAEISEEDTVIPASHRLREVGAVTSDDLFACNAIAHWECAVCGALFADEKGTEELTEADIYEAKSFTLTDASATSADSVSYIYADLGEEEKAALAVTEDKFVLRIFLGWGGETSVAERGANGENFRINLNLDPRESYGSKWFSFRYGYDANGLFAHFSDQEENKTYLADLEGGDALVEEFAQSNGLYFVIVRSGVYFTAYAEDPDGNLYQVSRSTLIGTDALTKITVGVNSYNNYVVSEECPAIAKDGSLVIGTTSPDAVK